ncbi:MAG: hemagglutinin repeat-containing protein, partial [Azoarcus sp.]|nr:hemagglutinin repeat-containing protein [Azoarcus sp.]
MTIIARVYTYLIETNPLFTDLASFLSSNHLLGLLGLDPDRIQRRLGDGGYEQKLLRDAILARTGQRFLAGYSDDETQYLALMDNAAAEQKALQLVLGVALSAEQIGALTRDIVWLVEKDIDGQKVLAPVLYLAQSGEHAPNGARLQGQNLLLDAEKIHTDGTVLAHGTLEAKAQQITNTGILQSNGSLSLTATTGDITNTGLIAANAVVLAAEGGNLLNQTSLATHQASTLQNTSAEQLNGGLRSAHQRVDLIGQTAEIRAAGTLEISAAGNLINLGGRLQSGGDAVLFAGQTLHIGALTTEQSADYERNGICGRQQGSSQSIEQHASQIASGGTLTLYGGNITVLASDLSAADDLLLLANGPITVAALANENHFSYEKEGGSKHKKVGQDTIRQRAATLSAGGDIQVRSLNDTITLIASELAAGGNLGLQAAGEINLLAAHDEDHSLYSFEREGLFGDTTKHDETHALRARGNTLSAGGAIVLDSGGDQHHQGSRLAAPEVTLASGGDLHFDAVKDTRSETHIDSGNNGLWQHYEGEGRTHELVRQSQIVAERFNASAQGQITVELPRISARSERAVLDIGLPAGLSPAEGFALLKQRNDALRQDDPASVVAVMTQIDPGLGWLTQLNQDNIDWQRVDELHSGWDESHSGLGTVGAIIVAVVVAIVTYGAASAVIGSAAGAAPGTALASTTTVGTTTVSAGWANVALSSGIAGTVSSAAVQVGTSGKVDWNLALKSGLIATLTAGLTNYGFEALDGQSLNQIAGLAPSAGASSGVGATAGWNFNTPEQLAALVGRGVVNAGIESAINRTEFKDAFVQSLVSDAAALTARDIGAKWGSGADRNPVMQTVA